VTKSGGLLLYDVANGALKKEVSHKSSPAAKTHEKMTSNGDSGSYRERERERERECFVEIILNNRPIFLYIYIYTYMHGIRVGMARILEVTEGSVCATQQVFFVNLRTLAHETRKRYRTHTQLSQYFIIDTQLIILKQFSHLWSSQNKL